MPLFSSIPYLGEEMIKAISWTLLHSLWQGILLALISACIIFRTKKANSSLRYNLLAAALLVFVTGVAATFVIQFMKATEAAVQASTMPVSQIYLVESSGGLITENGELTIKDHAVNFFNINASWIVLAWLLIIGYKFIRLSAGLYKIYHLKKYGVSSAGEYWNKKVAELCWQLRINKKVQLLQSQMVCIPVVIGYFKPVILFPASILMAMPLQEVEAVLLHELGHIRRGDFLVNLLQNIIEIVFFFNPAILWVSSLIKTERENCCDDMVLSQTGNKRAYINALISFQQFSPTAIGQFETAFTGEKNHLLNRVKRIVHNNNQTLNSMEKKFLSAGIILGTLCLFVFISMKAQNDGKMNSPVHIGAAETAEVATNKMSIKSEENTISQTTSASSDKTTTNVTLFAETDSVPVYKVGGKGNMTGTTTTSVNGKPYKIVLTNSVVTELYIDGQQIPSNKIIDHKLTLDGIYSRWVNESEEQAMRDIEQDMSDKEQAMRDIEQDMRDKEQDMRDREQAMRDKEQAMRDKEQARTLAGPRRSETSAISSRHEAIKEEENIKKIIQELIEDKIITSGENLSFFLSEAKFIVNDKKQSIEIAKKYFTKYGYKGFNRLYNFRTD
jgi:beta-lactamase regulating signal transducer with metallopeptidase domain